MNSALRFRAQAPLVDQLLREIGVDAGDVGKAARGLLDRGQSAALPRSRPRAAPSPASSRMIKVYVSSVIDAPADAVWAQIRDFNGLPKWTPFVAESRIEGGLARRHGRLRPQLPPQGRRRHPRAAPDAVRLRLPVHLLDPRESPMGVENYVATLKLTPVTDGDRTFAEWSAEFDCAPEREGELAQQHRPGRVPGRASTPSRRLFRR